MGHLENRSSILPEYALQIRLRLFPGCHLAKIDGPLDLSGYETIAKPQTFGRWVLAQVGRGGFVRQVATIAQSDQGFPKDGTAEAVHKRLGDTGEDPEMFDAVDDAELIGPAGDGAASRGAGSVTISAELLVYLYRVGA